MFQFRPKNVFSDGSLEESQKQQQPEETAEALLSHFLQAEDPATAEASLSKLVTVHAEPAIGRMVNKKFHSYYKSRKLHERQDEEDIRSTTVLRLISHLHQLKTDGSKSHIKDFTAYVAASTSNCCNEVLRSRYPMRWRLKNRIRYLLKHRTRFDLFQNENHDWLCRLVMPPVAPGRNGNEPSGERTDLDDFVASIAGSQNIYQMILEELVYAYLRWAGKPILLDDLVGIVAELQGVCDVPADYRQTDNEDGGIGDLLPDPSVNIVRHVEMRFYLQELWNEIRELQVRQRTALLLNLRDTQDRDALILFTLTGIVKSSEIADLLGMPLEKFGEYWRRLPLDDCAIGELLGISRQQVINLRKSARTRLARRVAAKWESGKGSR